MKLLENVPLSSLTTLKVGGSARYVAECRNEDDIQTALAFSHERGLPWYVIGGGSNLLAPDDGFSGTIIRPFFDGMTFTDAGEAVKVHVGVGVVWNALVQESVERGLWGLENLAAIPGLVGGAPVQNIGAYGADTADTLSYVDAFDTKTGSTIRFSKEDCAFGYRDSRFKHDPSLIITAVGFLLLKNGVAHIQYPDLVAYAEKGGQLSTPKEIAAAVAEIRSKKFPDLSVVGTAGSFFKNPVISAEKYAALRAAYPDLPGFPQTEGATESTVKVPLAWILDHVLHLRGYTVGNVRLFEKQPLVLVAEQGATASEINSFVKDIADKVKDATGIEIEREVRTFF
jgi:UDP-N-acetylmuramate dehydrogenase